LRFHHIGHATKSLERSAKFLEATGYKRETELIVDELIDVRIEFWTSEFAPRIELVEPNSELSSVWKILYKRGGPYHYAFEVENLSKAAESLIDSKFVSVTEPLPAVAFGGRLVCFYASADGAVVELIEVGTSELI